PELRAHALFALGLDRAAHQLGEPPRDCEAEAGPAVATRRRGIDLAERGEEAVHPVAWDPDPGVADGELEAVRAAGGPLRLDEHDHLAVLGELDGVREEVEEHLAQPGGVADDARGRAFVDQAAELDALLPGTRGDDLERPLDALPQV